MYVQYNYEVCISLYTNLLLSLPSRLRRITCCAIIITVVAVVVVVVVFVDNIFFDHCGKTRDMETL